MSFDLRLTQLIERYFDGTLNAEDAQELNRALSDSAGGRAEFWELAKLHNMLHEAEKLNAGSSSALRAMSREECEVEVPRIETGAMARGRTWSWKSWAFATAAVLFIGCSIYFGARTLQTPANADTVYVAQLRHSENAEWAGGVQFNDGDHVPVGPLELQSGLAELVFLNGAAVAIEGPAKVDLRSTSRMILHRGNISADVPKRAIGFTVETPDSKVIDLGTRFGVKVDSKGVTEAAVFEGKVVVKPGKNIKGSGKQVPLSKDKALVIDGTKKSMTAGKSDIREYPTPHRVIPLPLKDGSFESGVPPGVSGWTDKTGVWSGDYCSAVDEEQDVKPHSGKSMLKFQLTFNSQSTEDRRRDLLASDQFQILDLSEYKPLIEKGGCSVEVSGWFRCAVGNPESNNRFGLGVYSFKGTPKQAVDLWKNRYAEALGSGLKEIPTERAEKQWQNLRTSIQLSSNSDLLLVHVYAKHLMASSDASEEFPGHFADSIELKLHVAPQAGNKAGGK